MKTAIIKMITKSPHKKWFIANFASGLRGYDIDEIKHSLEQLVEEGVLKRAMWGNYYLSEIK